VTHKWIITFYVNNLIGLFKQCKMVGSRLIVLYTYMYVNISRVSGEKKTNYIQQFQRIHSWKWLHHINSYTNNISNNWFISCEKTLRTYSNCLSKALYTSTSLSLTTINKIPLNNSSLYDHIRTDRVFFIYTLLKTYRQSHQTPTCQTGANPQLGAVPDQNLGKNIIAI